MNIYVIYLVVLSELVMFISGDYILDDNDRLARVVFLLYS